jgi:type IV pilus assembly protein PilC
MLFIQSYDKIGGGFGVGLYKYRAKTSSGKEIQGELVSDSLNEAANLIREKGLYITKLKLAKSKVEMLWTLGIFQRANQRELFLLCRQLATMLSAGLSVSESIKALMVQDSLHLSVLQKSVQQVYEQLQAGCSLADALYKQKNVFPESMIHVIAAGEAGGTLEIVLEDLSNYMEREYEASEKMKSAMMYPILLFIMANVVTGFILCFVLPTFVVMFSNLHISLPLPTRILLILSKFALEDGWLIFLLATGLIFIGKYFYNIPLYRLRWDHFLFTIPLLGGLIKTTDTMRFTSVLATLLAGGIVIDEAMVIVKKVVENHYMQWVLEKVEKDLQRGCTLSDSLTESGLFSPMFLQMISVGEVSGELDKMLRKISDFCRNSIDVLSHRLQILMEPIMIIVLGILIGTLVLAIALPMFDTLTAF